MLSRFFNGFSDINFGVLLLSIPSVMIALMVHEVSHGYVAHLCGDDTAKNHGRLSFNIFRHLDPVGTLLLLFFGYGYARPVPVNYRNLRKPRRDIALVSLAGPGSNLIMAFLAVVLYYIILIVFTVTSGVSTENTGIFISRLLGGNAMLFDPQWLLSVIYGGDVSPVLAAFLSFLCIFASMNIGLALFNLIPFPPLDGSKVVSSLLPVNAAAKYLRLEFYSRYVFLALMVLFWVFPSVSSVLFYPLNVAANGILWLFQAFMLLFF